tara:strand:- start:251 stop:886 length:636 start_codon:yes stop_codon:yes gene_type:complete
MMKREIVPEILDTLDPTDPAAIRSRKDLRFLNFMMGNDRWVRSTVAAHSDSSQKGITEIGAGEGRLLSKLADHGPASGVDLAPRPPDLNPSISWIEGDLFENSPDIGGGVLVANLFLHHFNASDLARIGTLAENFEVLIFSEPLRNKNILRLSQCVMPLMGSVTRHDMPVSIRAGFVMDEISTFLRLPDAWQISEHGTALGAIRTVARRSR